MEEQFREFRDYFGKKRKAGARRMRGIGWSGLHVMRDLRCEVLGNFFFYKRSLHLLLKADF